MSGVLVGSFPVNVYLLSYMWVQSMLSSILLERFLYQATVGKLVIIGASSCAASLSIKAVMESGPVAFVGFEVFHQLENTIAGYCDV